MEAECVAEVAQWMSRDGEKLLLVTGCSLLLIEQKTWIYNEKLYGDSDTELTADVAIV